MARDHDFSDSAVEEAKRLVDEIREKHTSVVHDELEVIVNDLLHITSSELYDVSTHCLLELLQNADDNHYTSTAGEPTLALTCKGRHLQVDCNEDGFEAKHVRSISTIRRSTKSGKNHSSGYTGEKGIGFKSVFRIASRVWISSRQFQFMFDKNLKFGIIAPVWQSFPPPHRPVPGHTSFLLELSDDEDGRELRNALLEFDPILLLFLRNLTKLTLRLMMDDEFEWVTTITKTTKSEHGELMAIINHDVKTTESASVTHHAQFQKRHIIFKHDVDNLPREPRRVNITTSTLSLAFPIDGLPEKPTVSTQQVFTLLPVCDHGLKFKLNGDFVLSASRLNIDASLPWNQRLRDGLVDAFTAAVRAFVENDGAMRYIWPFYVPDSETSAFFRPARDGILRALTECPVLESVSGEMLPPSKLVYVDPKYAFLDHENNKQPFTLTSKTATKYLSMRYPAWSIDSILSLGVLRLTDRAFLEDLEAMIAADPKGFQSRTVDWHQELAKVLLPLSRLDMLRSFLRRLPIVPLSDGTWVSASRNPVFSSSSLRLSQLPSSLSLLVVDPQASANASRRLLYQSLGISEISSPLMCRYIVDAHNSPGFKPEQLTRVDLISHATYLFQSSWQPPEDMNVDLWFATTDGGRCKGSKLYIRGDYKPNSATARVFEKLRQRYPTIRDNYFLGPISSDAVTLADSSDCSFVTYQKRDSSSNYWTAGLELTFEVDNDFFSRQLENNLKGPFILAENFTAAATERGNQVFDGEENIYSFVPPPTLSVPALPVVHNDYYVSVVDREPPGYDSFAATFLRESNELGRALLEPGRIGSRIERIKPATRHRYQRRRTEIPKPDEIKPDSFNAWRNYMVATLHLSEIPRLVQFPDPSSRHKYQLSDEFKFLFQACSPSDLLHLLNEHWRSYAKWVEPGISELRDIDAAESHARLLDEIGSRNVATRCGVHQLRDTILSGVDAEIDSFDMPTPVLEMPDSQDKTLRRRLGVFGINVDNDLEYYLACLRALHKQDYCPDDYAISYLYEQIQARYSGKEDEVNKIFEANAYVYLGPNAPKASKSRPWVTLDYCTKARIDVCAVYPGCRTLFHGLLGSDGREVEDLVRAARLIDQSWGLTEISKHLIKISARLQDATSTRARLWVGPLQGRAIFPTRSSQEIEAYDNLVSSADGAWFIADHACFQQSFQGIVPLLAFSTAEIAKMSALLEWLGLEGRRLSVITEESTFPARRPTYSERDTQFFRDRTIYITMLIPESHPEYSVLENQLDNTHVCTASSISHRYTIKSDDPSIPEYQGRLTKRDIALRPGRDDLRVFLADTGIPLSRRNRMPLADAIAAHCGIVSERSRRLLYTALCEPDLERVDDYFEAAGHEFEYETDSDSEQGPGNGKPQQDPTQKKGFGTGYDEVRPWESRVQTQSGGHSGPVPPANWDPDDFLKPGQSHHPDALRGGVKTRVPPVDDPKLAAKSDRRLPFVHIGPQGGLRAEGEAAALDLDQHLEYLGESLTSQMFQNWGVDGYRPVTHWTSKLRVRAGLPPAPRVTEDMSPFTVDGLRASQGMTELLRRLGLAVDDHFDGWGHPTYHFEVAISTKTWGSPFVWSSSQLRRIQKRQLGKPLGSYPDDVMVLVHISSPYSEPQFKISLDPWDLVITNRMIIQGQTKFPMVIKPLLREAPGGGHALQPPQTVPILPVDTGDDPFGDLFDTELQSGVPDFTPSLPRNAVSCRQFVYSNLHRGEFRLFMLFPGKENDALRGAIFTCVSGESIPPFQALSYEWGPETQGQKYTIDTETGQLVIRKSLDQALRKLRGGNSTMILWIDAICINQTDDTEKAKQIPLLPRIFQLATCTLAIVTDKGNHGGAAMQTLLQIVAKARREANPQDSKWPAEVPSIPSSWKALVKPLPSDPVWASIQSFFSSTFFRRAWIIQEMVISPTVKVLCGQWTADWNYLALAVDIIMQSEPLLPQPITSSFTPFLALSNLREWESRKYRWNLLSLLETFSYADSTLARDRFFALLGIASDGNLDDFEPDYSKNTSFETIAKRYGRAFVTQGRGMQLLYRAAGVTKTTNTASAPSPKDASPDRFPSWLPDFTTTTPQSTRLLTSSDRGTVFKASKGFSASLPILCADDYTLFLAGSEVDTITRISKARNQPGPKQWGSYFREIDSMLKDLMLRGGETERERLAMTVPVAGAMLFGEVSIQEAYRSFRFGLRECRYIKDTAKREGKWNAMSEGVRTWQAQKEEYVALLVDGLVGWVFFVTERGHCGIAPGGAEVGDKVLIVSGGDVPFLVRMGRGDDFFRLVGACYVDGMMAGEALQFEGVTKELVYIQ